MDHYSLAFNQLSTRILLSKQIVEDLEQQVKCIAVRVKLGLIILGVFSQQINNTFKLSLFNDSHGSSLRHIGLSGKVYELRGLEGELVVKIKQRIVDLEVA